MKIAITSQGKDLDSQVDPRFGRAAYIIVVDSDNLEFQVIDNDANVNAMKGAGIQAASNVVNSGAQVLLTGHCGPNAFKALQAGKVKVANDATGAVKEAVKAYLDGKLPHAENADVEGHW
ncbi:MAG: dinitrogenase iron-molybdenum cofactor biosynthesis protein [Desulfatiglans sp.]|jgi:predicted Fe-Mo cluster-binding NifX family protein|nr:dinitrogenase iron-molybdenum cofactor biosynthesis protein [Desulfatiglans sp.]